MRASFLGAVLAALTVAGCNFSINGLGPGEPAGASDLGALSDLAVGSNAGTGDLAQPIDLAPTRGLLTGAIAITSANLTVDLTAEGTGDWAHWGTVNAASFDHKSLVTSAISNFTNIKSSNMTPLSGYAVGFTWADGTPTAAATNSTTGVYTNGDGTGFRITVPADLTTRTLRLYAGGQMSTATVTAHLSDASAADYSVSAAFGAGDSGNQYERTVTLTYHAASAGQTLAIDWVQAGSNGFVHLHSATLQ